MHRRYAILLAVGALAGAIPPASAQVLSRLAVSRTAAAASIEQPAMIASSQDLMFVVSTSTMSLRASIASGTSASTAVRNAGPTRIASLPAIAGTGLTVPARASFVLVGDSGQSISVTVPEAVNLTRAGGNETAQLITDSSVSNEPQILAGPFASEGTLSFDVGGQVTLASVGATTGTYNGVLAVVAQYN